VIRLRYLEGYSVAEIAQSLNRSYQATEALVSEARRHLQIGLGDQPGMLPAVLPITRIATPYQSAMQMLTQHYTTCVQGGLQAEAAIIVRHLRFLIHWLDEARRVAALVRP
jgi:hypothetical protein